MIEARLLASAILSPALAAAVRDARDAAERVVRAHEDAEAIHDLRVAIRRIRTVVGAGRRVYGKRRVARLVEELRGLAKATNALRDEEVLGETIALCELEPEVRARADAWIDRRVAVLRELRGLGLAMLDRSGLGDVLAALSAIAVGPPKHDCDAEELAFAELCRARSELCAVLPAVTTGDAVALHRLRIRFKRLRYTAEMFGGAMRASDAEPALGTAKRHLKIARNAAGYQKELGLVHDCDVALETARSARDIDDATRPALIAALSATRDRLARKTVERIASDLRAIVMGDV
jgi:CHAD domain-containing protein